MSASQRSWKLVLMMTLAAVQVACSDGQSAGNPAESKGSTVSSSEVATSEVNETPPERSTPSVFGEELEVARYDLKGLAEQDMLRVLVGYSHTHYFMDGLHIRGITAENLRQFDPVLQTHLGSPNPKVNILPIPVARDQMIEFLADGLGDIAIGNITITPARAREVDFSVPIYSNVSEIIVQSSESPRLTGLNDLSGRTIHIRRSSSYFESVVELNESFSAQGLPPVAVVAVDEMLQTEDILELVNAGVVGITVADSHLAEFWSNVHPKLVVRNDLELKSGREIAWAIRKDFTGMKEIVDKFIRQNRQGTLVGNVLFQRYLQDNRYVHNASASADRKRFQAMTELFRRYSNDYDFDWLLVAAQAYQESRLIQSQRSPAGAIGVMQLLPSTAMAPPISIPDIEDLEANVHAGHKYLRHIADHYFDDPEMDELNRHLFSFAAYNAGPTRISRLRREAARRGLDPNEWFGVVERVVAEEVGMEPVTYVRNIFKYYVTYKLMQANEDAIESAEVVDNNPAAADSALQKARS
jgi:membrane-bound lytic murein transglycosylase MltF